MRLFLYVGILTIASACDLAGPQLVAASSSAEPNPARLDEPVTITISMANISDREMTIAAPVPTPCTRFYTLLDPSGRQAVFQNPPCADPSAPPQMTSLAPGQTVIYSDTWTATSVALDGQPIPAGRYEVRPGNFGDVRFGSRSSTVLELTTPP